MHGLVPPHPAAMAAVGFKADVGKTILYALIVGLPTVIISPLYGKWIGARIHKEVPLDIVEQFIEKIIKRASKLWEYIVYNFTSSISYAWCINSGSCIK